IFQVKHCVREQCRRANILIAKGVDCPTIYVESQQPRSVVIRVRDPELLTQVSKAIVDSASLHADIVRTAPNFVEDIGTEIVSPGDYAIFYSCLAETVVK